MKYEEVLAYGKLLLIREKYIETLRVLSKQLKIENNFDRSLDETQWLTSDFHESKSELKRIYNTEKEIIKLWKANLLLGNVGEWRTVSSYKSLINLKLLINNRSRMIAKNNGLDCDKYEKSFIRYKRRKVRDIKKMWGNQHTKRIDLEFENYNWIDYTSRLKSYNNFSMIFRNEIRAYESIMDSIDAGVASLLSKKMNVNYNNSRIQSMIDNNWILGSKGPIQYYNGLKKIVECI